MQETTNGGNNAAVGPSNFLLVLKHRAIIISMTSAIANCTRTQVIKSSWIIVSNIGRHRMDKIVKELDVIRMGAVLSTNTETMYSISSN